MRHLPARILLVLALTALALPAASVASAAPSQAGGWRAINGAAAASRDGAAATIRPDRAAHVALDRAALQAALPTAQPQALPQARATTIAGVVTLPTPEGGYARFAVRPSQVMAPGLAAAHPNITTYSGRGLDEPAATVRLDLGPLGLHASVRSPHGAWYVDPSYRRDLGDYLSYYGRDLKNPHGAFVERDGSRLADAQAALGTAAPPLSTGPQLRTYRLALLNDPSYADYFGAANVTAAKVALVNRVNQIYEEDLAIHLVLIDQTDRLNLATPALATEPGGPCGDKACFRPGELDFCSIGAIERNDTVLGQLVGASAYDIGHIALGRNGGGIAGLGVVGGRNKAIGCTGVPEPVGDFYAVDYVAHEMGHQFGGNHTFNGVNRACSGGNRNPETSVEPGSGSTVMAYAGICGKDDLQPHSDPYFSERSFTEMETYVSSRRAPDAEVQTVSLRGFDARDAFAFSYNGARSPLVVHGVNDTREGIAAAIEAIPGLPVGLTVRVRPFALAGPVDDRGFRLEFGGPPSLTDLPELGLTALTGVTGFVGETVQGGPENNAGAVTATGNHPPAVTAPASYTIPLRTPFALSGGATDPDGDTPTYLWEQNDRGGHLGTALVDPVKRDGPLFRVFGRALDNSVYDPTAYDTAGENATTTTPTRVFPDLQQVLAGNTNAATGDCPGAPVSGVDVPRLLVNCYSEFLPTQDYVGLPGVNADPPSLHFRLTARDGNPAAGGVAYADTTLVLARGSGPFLVTSQPAGTSYAGGSRQTVTWQVAGTDAAPVGTRQVRITLSRDGGRTWPVVLAAATANDGSEQVSLPAGASEHARIRVEAVGNVFFAVNPAEFRIAG